MVFVHEIDPSMGDKKHMEDLYKVHQGEDKFDLFKELTGGTGGSGRGAYPLVSSPDPHGPKINC